MNISQLEKKNRYQMRRRAFEEAKREAIDMMHETINRGLAMQMEMTVLLVLHDKFGFGAERCARALVSFEEMWADVLDNRLDLDDIESVVKDEIGIIIEEEAIYQLDTKKNKKKIWPKEIAE